MVFIDENNTKWLGVSKIGIRVIESLPIRIGETSYTKIHMNKLMKELGDELYYTDTDSQRRP
jgi:hypothetical protein